MKRRHRVGMLVRMCASIHVATPSSDLIVRSGYLVRNATMTDAVGCVEGFGLTLGNAKDLAEVGWR
jgi:hypothetical protein